MMDPKLVAAAIAGLCHFIFADGVSFGVGTVGELDQLKADGIVPADAIAKPMTVEEAIELLA